MYKELPLCKDNFLISKIAFPPKFYLYIKTDHFLFPKGGLYTQVSLLHSLFVHVCEWNHFFYKMEGKYCSTVQRAAMLELE